MTRVAIALGSNLGDRESLLEFARRRLRAVLTEFTASKNYETVPVGVTGHQPMFLNAAVTGSTTLKASALLAALHAIEREAGRERPHPGAARTLDLDLILYGDEIVNEPGLRVPHPAFRERLFVLDPLWEIAPDVRDPESGHTIEELRRLLRDRGAPRQ